MKVNSPEEAVDQITGNYRIQLEKYRAILTLAKEQLTAAQDGNTIMVNEILGRRQELITEIDNLNAVLAITKAEVVHNLNLADFTLTEISKALPLQARELQKVIVQIGEVLVASNEVDNLNQQVLSQNHPVVSKEKSEKKLHEVKSAYQRFKAKNKEDRLVDRSE